MSVGTCLQQAGKTGVPRDIVFKTKPQLAMQQIEAAHPRGVVLADAAYGDETAWRERLAGHGLTYAVGIYAVGCWRAVLCAGGLLLAHCATRRGSLANDHVHL